MINVRFVFFLKANLFVRNRINFEKDFLNIIRNNKNKRIEYSNVFDKI